jgi:hypothetical protein
MKNHQIIKLLLLSVIFTNTLFGHPAGDVRSQRITQPDLNSEAEKLLAERGYWITKVDGKRDSSTYHAIVAFQKVEKLKRTGRLTEKLLAALRKSKRPKSAYSGAAHIEIDLSRQVLFLVNDKEIVTHILPVSSGNEKNYYQDGKRQVAHTPRGIFKITRQIKGIRRAPLGILYHPNYFYKGVAIHGSGSIPFYPASHGCVRIPRFAAKKFSDLVAVGMYVVLFDRPNPERPVIGEQKMAKTQTRKTLYTPCQLGS